MCRQRSLFARQSPYSAIEQIWTLEAYTARDCTRRPHGCESQNRRRQDEGLSRACNVVRPDLSLVNHVFDEAPQCGDPEESAAQKPVNREAQRVAASDMSRLVCKDEREFSACQTLGYVGRYIDPRSQRSGSERGIRESGHHTHHAWIDPD